jgi:uncharacterized protein YjbJ (UPF0337 family)
MNNQKNQQQNQKGNSEIDNTPDQKAESQPITNQSHQTHNGQSNQTHTPMKDTIKKDFQPDSEDYKKKSQQQSENEKHISQQKRQQQQQQQQGTTDVIKAKWQQQVGAAKKLWGKLTDDEIMQSNGDAEKLAGLVKERYAVNRIEADKQVKKFLAECNC